MCLQQKGKMVEQSVMVEVGGGKMAMNSSSSAAINPLPLQARPPDYRRYPTPMATYEEVVASPALFMLSLEKVHAAMGTKFMIPTVGGRDLDLHRLFVQVTSRGGIAKVLQERKWRDVFGNFSFPSSATNASFVLRKYYFSLLHHYEQIYYLKAEGWSPTLTDSLQLSSSRCIPQGRVEPAHSSTIPKAASTMKATIQESTTRVPEAAATPTATAGSELFGVIDGKFDSGYLVTVRIGSEQYKGVLYHTPSDPPQQSTEPQSNQQYQGTSVDRTNSTAGAVVVGRRKRRKKSEIKKRDPSHPKPNRSGYNFFFAEQHARLKPLHPGKDRDISRIIGDSWNKLTDAERVTYQEKAVRDKERYKMEMETYKERLKTGQIISNAAPIHQQHFHLPSISNMDVDHKPEMAGVTSSNSPEVVISSNVNSETNTELSIGQTASDGNAMQLLSLRPDLNLIDLGKTVESEDAPNSSVNNGRKGEERNAKDHPVNEKGGKIEVFPVQNSVQENAFGKNQANEEIFKVQKSANVYGNQGKACSVDASAVQNF